MCFQNWKNSFKNFFFFFFFLVKGINNELLSDIKANSEYGFNN